MSKLKDTIITMHENMPDMSTDEIISEDIFFRYNIDLPTAVRVMTLMRLSLPPETLYAHNPELFQIWLKEFLNDTNRNQLELDLFDEGDTPWVWEKHYGV